MQTTTTKTIRCAQCGSKNPADAHRCRTCTRPLDTPESSSNADFEQQLWADPITSNPPRKPISPWLLVVVALVGAAVGNYYWLRAGPSWAHVAKPVPKGSEWRTFSGQPQVVIAMPGDPETFTSPTPAGAMTVAQSWVDGHWDVIRDRHTQSVAALSAARHGYFAVVAIATVAAPRDPAIGAAQLVSSMEPPMVTSDLTTAEVKLSSIGRQFDVSGHFDNWPLDSGSGTVKARVIVDKGQAVVIAAFYRQDVDPALLSRMVDDYFNSQDAAQ